MHANWPVININVVMVKTSYSKQLEAVTICYLLTTLSVKLQLKVVVIVCPQVTKCI